jgi:DNA-binding Lrp family transcriptional regulator
MMSMSLPMGLTAALFVPPSQRWFAGCGCVLEAEGFVEVRVGGLLVGRFAEDDIGARNAILVGLTADGRVPLGEIAAAFGLTAEAVRLVRRRYEREGLLAVVSARRGGITKVTVELRVRLCALFDAKLSVTEATERVRDVKPRVQRATVGTIRKEWAAKKAAEIARPSEEAGDERAAPEAASQEEYPNARVRESSDSCETASGPVGSGAETQAAMAAAANGSSVPVPNARVRDAGGEREGAEEGPVRPVEAAHEGCLVQHAGAWLLLGQLARYPLHEVARAIAVSRSLDGTAVRLAIDAFAVTLAQGESCVEGVRRLATSTAAMLLGCESTPSADWVRSTLHGLADVGADELHMGMVRRTLALARAQTGPAVFFLDNHMRPYTGQEVLRRGWRMQAKRVLPGTTDYYLHNGDGRPLFRMTCPAHDPLTEVLLPIADTVRATLGSEQRLLFVFDRAGSYPEALSSLRDESFEFVTYERRPYRQLRTTEFVREMVIEDERGKPEQLRFAEFYVPLGGGHGDVRRIAVLTPDERQYNLLAITPEPAERVIELMRSRWASQENAFKHAVERWSTNHLDGRHTEPYAPDTIVPNPARRRLDHELRLARVQEGLARNDLAKLDEDNPKRERALTSLAEGLRLQQELLARRPTTPKRAPLAETELAGKLVFHPPAYKLVLDTVRIACANAEEDLVEMLAPHLPRAAEAKKTLAALFAAPGHVHESARTITVALDPAGTAPEHEAYACFYAKVNAAALSLPGDSRRRRLVFKPQERMDA